MAGRRPGKALFPAHARTAASRNARNSRNARRMSHVSIDANFTENVSCVNLFARPSLCCVLEPGLTTIVGNGESTGK